ncbi:plastocyanin [Aquimarina sp. EL_43]|uniref:cupredoxin domain-containing protein n=1 Tax=Aquimarina TaxID=290174 RepID=UPI0004715220|nr:MULTISPECIES: cupredoxin domain-containing protein [Aquimarina]MBG6128574.1 plastocyanin [Aquimarina sp. EL_35]MBG6149637.1 plastocyanin [Aquimarina sp. EL_32]MBG6167678.1 plastocyanin [Aquimarina sp. EL_43]
MKKLITVFSFILAITFSAQAQKVKNVSLEQTKGEFTQKEIKLSEGSYVFNITNNHAGTDVGFVLVPEGKDASNAENHIKTAYVTKVVAEGKTESSQTVKLQRGTYKYFCPLNKTPQYTLIVE